MLLELTLDSLFFQEITFFLVLHIIQYAINRFSIYIKISAKFPKNSSSESDTG